MKKAGSILFICFCFTMQTAKSQVKKGPVFTVSEAPEWTSLFKRTSGWFGGDGIFTIPLNGVERNGSSSAKTLFIFSDTMIGEIKDGKLEPGSKMIHNSIALLTGKEPLKDQMMFFWKNMNKADVEPVFIPKTPKTGAADYFWLGDGFVNEAMDNAIYIFGYRVKTTDNTAFGFEEVGNVLIKIDPGQRPPYTNYQQKDTPFYFSKGNKGTGMRNVQETGSFGAGIYVNTVKAGAARPDGHIYIYGVKGKNKKLLVARVQPNDFENYNKWMFWDGMKWNADMKQSAPVTDGVSNELSISALPDGSYALVFQEGGLSKYIDMRIGKSPVGPFGPPIRLWDCSDAAIKKSYFSYNAKAHPSLSKKGELLISYNVNSFNFFKDLRDDPQLYRPRFIRVKFQ